MRFRLQIKHFEILLSIYLFVCFGAILSIFCLGCGGKAVVMEDDPIYGMNLVGENNGYYIYMKRSEWDKLVEMVRK